ncbi:hypothetical protein Tsubulata_004826 [Turnera subulata]|uniref:Uncharacterized protein n=1 Tax=Turnera subulata TaxID=218843 RepID=A0A9Q0FCZ5_9ROSI|nr:hypothetical protein Tsubulata_004826 [Turnera subulata]
MIEGKRKEKEKERGGLKLNCIFTYIVCCISKAKRKESQASGRAGGWKMGEGAACPGNSIRYNGSLCACPVGQLLNSSANRCSALGRSGGIWTNNGVDYLAVSSFPLETIFSLESIKKLTRSQAVFLEATLVMVLLWLLFCFFLRFANLHQRGTPWFRLRWWISRLDICFATRHWLDDQQVVVKRKTELGGTFSIASWILFIGLLAALLYQVIANRTIEVHNVRALNAPDLTDFVNDMEMEFNLTTLSSTITCLNLRGLGTLATGTPAFLDFRLANLADFLNFTCHNTTNGPTLTFSCSRCQFTKDSLYISWHFVDLPSAPATAVGFQFNLTAKTHADPKHVNLVGGMLHNGTTFDDTPVTFRGNDSNVLKFNLFPRIYRNLHNLRLIQPLFHEFLPGSFFRDTTRLRASLETPADGIINTTLYINFLSAYVVEIQSQNMMGLGNYFAFPFTQDSLEFLLLFCGFLLCLLNLVFFVLLCLCIHVLVILIGPLQCTASSFGVAFGPTVLVLLVT